MARCGRMALAAAGLLAMPGLAWASSDLATGHFTETSSVAHNYDGAGTCTLTVGPRPGVKAGHFLLQVGDARQPESAAVSLTGTFSATQMGKRVVFTLTPDLAAARAYEEQVLRRQANNAALHFGLAAVAASAEAEKSAAYCAVQLHGQVSDGGTALGAARFGYGGPGQFFPSNMPLGGAPAAPPPAARVDNKPPCPTTLPVDKALAPLGIAPVPGKCSDSSCLVSFKGYQWWTSFQYYGKPGNSVFPAGGYFYNGDLGTAFAPKLSTVDARGLHLKARMVDLGGGAVPAGAESVLMFNPDGTQANLGYGDYLVTATVTTAADWGSLDPNVAFGVFQFERVGSGSRANSQNPAREIDLAEISTWGKYPQSKCPYTEKRLCTGNAQFTLQIWNKVPANLNRYTINPGVNTVTLVMRWHGANMPVTFEQYDGAFGLHSLPANPNNTWTTAASQNGYVPEAACGRFHLNLWFGNFPFNNGKPYAPNPGPASYPQEVVVSNFEFQPVK